MEAAKYADIIIFITPYSVILDFCRTLLGKIKPDAMAIAVTKGCAISESGGIQLISHIIMKNLKVGFFY